MNRKFLYVIRLFAFCLCAFNGIHTLRAQSTNAPVLSLAPGTPPALTVTGTPGAGYQVQFASQLAASNQWTALTNILLSNSAYLLHDPAAASNAVRFYRALLLSAPSNIFNGYAPAQILSGEIYQFVTTDPGGGTSSTQTLFISSATNGVWMAPPNALPVGGVSAVSLNFTRLSDLTVQLDVTFPATVSNPTPTTNSYLLAFDGTNAGVFTGPLGAPQQSVGNFSRVTNLIGTSVSSQLAAGEVWNLSASNTLGTSSAATLVMDSPTNGWWIVTGATDSGISAATAQFTPQGPLGGSLVVLVPSGPSVTNTFSVEFTATNSGLFEGALPGLGLTAAGTFTHDTTLVGRTAAPPQLAEGEIYQLAISNGPTETIAMESPGAGWVAVETNPPTGGLFPDNVQYTQLGPFSGNMVITAALNPPSTNLATNTWTLVFTTTNSGFVQNMVGTPTSGSLGAFVRNATSIGQTLAPQQLTAGDTYQLTTTSEQSAPGQSLAVNSPTNGLWLTVQSSPQLTLTTVDTTLQYSQIGPLSGAVTAVYATSPAPTTNTCTLLFTGTNSGLFEGTDSPGSPTLAVGTFSRDTTLENQSLAPAQLTAGETYQLLITNGPTVSAQTLILNSSTSGLLIVPASSPDGPGIFPASVQYAPLGAFGANLTLMLSAIGSFSASTNTYLLDFTSATGGVFEASSPNSPGGTAGGFMRSTALVGQSLAPQQLVNGESYQLTSTNQPQSSANTLIMNSATTGLWSVPSGPQGGIFSASVQYTPLGPIAADVDVILPPGSGSPSGSTNNFTLIFNSATNGVFQTDNSLSSPLPAGSFIHNTP
jgi:hypothetical protein